MNKMYKHIPSLDYCNHCYQVKNLRLWSQYQGNIFMVLIKQSRKGKLFFLIKGLNPNLATAKVKLP